MRWGRVWKATYIISLILAVTTIIPAPASKPNLVGYYSHCSYAPVSTLILLAVALVAYILFRRSLRYEGT